MHRIDIRSRLGNLILGIIGAAYLVAAVAVLVYAVMTAGGSLEMALLLVMCIAGSAWFVLIASGNLRGRRLPQ